MGRNEASEIVLMSPVNGTIIDIESVKDETIADKVLGDGVAMIPADGKICSPCDGVVDNMFETGHAFSIISDDGAEVLIHVGLDTVNLQGRHFKVIKNTGDKVKTGDVMVEADIEAIEKDGFDKTIAFIIMNSDSYSKLIKSEGDAVTGKEILRLIK